MYSPAALPSSTRAAPAKKRKLSAETGISSRAYESGLPTFRDSSSASSSALSSIALASPSSASARSPGVVSSHSGSAFFAASTARSTSACVPLGTSAITSPVAGFSTSIVPPSTASTHSPPTKFLCCETVTLIRKSLPFESGASLPLAATKQAGVLRQPLRHDHGDHRQDDNHEDDRVHLRELLAEPDLSEDPDRERVLRPGREERHDHLVEREREGEQAARDERRREHREGDEAEGLPAVGTEVHRRLDERGRRPPQPREDVVVDDHDAEGRVADHDRPERERHAPEGVEGRERDARDHARKRDRQHEQERERLAAEEAEARHGGGGHRPEHERDPRRGERRLQREQQRVTGLRVVPRDAEPPQREAGDRPALDVGGVEGVDEDHREREPEEDDDEGRPDAEPQARGAALHQSASIAPARRAS